jgi:hypothetical protein
MEEKVWWPQFWAERAKSRTMGPIPLGTCVVTDDETEERLMGQTGQIQGEHEKYPDRLAWQERLRRGFRHLVWMGPRGNRRPEIGAHCIVIGGTGRDSGQMAQVTDRTAKMVGIKYRGAKGHRLEYKKKRPSSLIMLEAGLVMKQDIHGTVWVCVDQER